MPDLNQNSLSIKELQRTVGGNIMPIRILWKVQLNPTPTTVQPTNPITTQPIIINK